MTMPFEPAAPVARGMIPLCVPEMCGREWQYVKECLDTNYVSSVGPFVDRFEREIAAYVGTRHAVATVNGTAALHVALIVSNVEPGDEVLVSDLSFIAPANAIRYVGAHPVFIDAEPSHWQMDPSEVERFLRESCTREGGATRNRLSGRRVSAIVPVHVLGHPVDMDPILALAREFGLAVIEDATESLGALYKGHKVGALADVACFSFNGNKVITTGGGGMLVTDNDAWARRAKYLTTQAKDDPIEFIHREIGFNYRLTNVQAAIGCAQLEVLDQYVSRKRTIASRYISALDDLPGVRPMREAHWAYSTHWMFTMLFEETQARSGSREVLRTLAAEGIQARPLWQPLHLSPAHGQPTQEECEVSEDLNRQCLSLPCSVGITEGEQDRVIAVLRLALG